VQITSATAGTTTVKAATDVVVNGQTLHRETDGTGTNSGPAAKNWGDDAVRTDVHDANHNVVTAVDAGTSVHDKAFVTRTAGTPAGVPDPTGNVVFHRYSTIDCTGTAVDQTVTLAADGTAETSSFTATANMSYKASYSGDANYPARDGACEPLTVRSQGGQIAPTQTTCEDYRDGTSDTLGQINYPVSGGKIGQGINPGVFFFYSKITTTTPNQVVTVTQTNTSSNGTPPFGIQNGQAWLWNLGCTTKLIGTVSGANDSVASYTIPTPGTYIISVKYQTKTIAGAPAPVPADITYNFATSLGGNTGASVLLKKQ
jgi:hypothetical protein